MKAIHLAILAIFLNSGIIFAQADSTILLKDAEKELTTGGATISSVLRNKKYLPIHPLTSFRDLIRNHANGNSISIASEDEAGKKIMVTGTIKNKTGQAVSNALVYLYQTDSRGWYASDKPHVGGNEGDRRHARLFGYLKTDAAGKFEYQTIKPKGYPQSDLPAHIHIEIIATGYSPGLISELLFDDDERLQGTTRTRAVNEGFIIAKPGPAKAPFEQSFSYTIILNK